ncbi:MAG TPA: hypothetical protein VHG08_26810 [Longimicrobium sp.]|nr:hypothetical protein [Longimicrobium sp.]
MVTLICAFLVFVVMPADVIADSWAEWDERRRRTALRTMYLLLGGFAAAGTMAALVDAGLTGAWPAWARGAWVAGMFASLLAGVLAWKRLVVNADA